MDRERGAEGVGGVMVSMRGNQTTKKGEQPR